MRIPEHIGIIPDGNRRWARQAGLAKEAGYAYGLAPGLELLRLARDAGVREITYYGFTTDNCGRPSEQVRAFSAAHPEHILDAGAPGMALGYQLTFGGFTVVHLGDTYLTPHLYETLQALPRPDLLLAPINGQDFFRTQRNCIGNLEAEEAAQLAVRLGAACTIPTHYDMVQGNTVDPLRFAAALRQLDPAACFALPALGERLLFQAAAGRKDSSVFSCPPPSSSIQR